jgi:hypothetical protein
VTDRHFEATLRPENLSFEYGVNRVEAGNFERRVPEVEDQRVRVEFSRDESNWPHGPEVTKQREERR